MEIKLPEGWEIKNLVKHIPIVKTGVREYKGEKAYYSTGAVVNDSISPEGHYSFRKKPSRANRLVIKGDVVQARMQGTTKALLIDENLDRSLFSTGFLQFRPSEYNYNSKLFYHYLCSDLFLKQRDEFASGSTQIALTDKGASHINLVIPPPEQQKRIADRLDSLLAKVKDAQSRLDKIPTILSRFRQSVLAAAFSGELTKAWRKKKCSDVSVKNSIPESWCWTKLGELSLSITSGSRGWAKYYSTKGAIFIRSQDIKTDSLDLNNVAHVSLPNKAEGKRTKVTKGDLLITITGANVAKAACIDRDIDEAYVSQHVGLIRLKNPKMANFIHLCMISSNHGRKQLLDSAYGVGKPGLNLDNLKDVDIACPPLDEQQEINRVVKEYFSEIDKIALRYRNTKNCTNRLEQSILAKAFRGELAR